jgi:hypothetical protein
VLNTNWSLPCQLQLLLSATVCNDAVAQLQRLLCTCALSSNSDTSSAAGSLWGSMVAIVTVASAAAADDHLAACSACCKAAVIHLRIFAAGGNCKGSRKQVVYPSMQSGAANQKKAYRQTGLQHWMGFEFQVCSLCISRLA